MVVENLHAVSWQHQYSEPWRAKIVAFWMNSEPKFWILDEFPLDRFSSFIEVISYTEAQELHRGEAPSSQLRLWCWYHYLRLRKILASDWLYPSEGSGSDWSHMRPTLRPCNPQSRACCGGLSLISYSPLHLRAPRHREAVITRHWSNAEGHRPNPTVDFSGSEERARDVDIMTWNWDGCVGWRFRTFIFIDKFLSLISRSRHLENRFLGFYSYTRNTLHPYFPLHTLRWTLSSALISSPSQGTVGQSLGLALSRVCLSITFICIWSEKTFDTVTHNTIGFIHG